MPVEHVVPGRRFVALASASEEKHTNATVKSRRLTYEKT